MASGLLYEAPQTVHPERRSPRARHRATGRCRPRERAPVQPAADPARFGERVGSKLSLQEVVSEVVAGGRELLSGDAAWVYFLDASSRALVAASTDEPPIPGLTRIDVTHELWSGLAQGKAVPITNIEELIDRPTGPMSAVVAPIPGSDSTIDRGRPRPVRSSADPRSRRCRSPQRPRRAERDGDRERAAVRTSAAGRTQPSGRPADYRDAPEMGQCTVGAVYEPAGGESRDRR